MNSFNLGVDPREAQYARLAANALRVLRGAVAHRAEEGVSQAEIGHRIGMDKGMLSRILNGRVRNITLRTLSDILWAAEYEPTTLSADSVESLMPNYRPTHLRVVKSQTATDGRQVGSIYVNKSGMMSSGDTMASSTAAIPECFIIDGVKSRAEGAQR